MAIVGDNSLVAVNFMLPSSRVQAFSKTISFKNLKNLSIPFLK
jgi:hypothetical protein